MAATPVLDTLTPAERLAFVLHDVFGMSFGEVGQIVGRTVTGGRIAELDMVADPAKLRHLALHG